MTDGSPGGQGCPICGAASVAIRTPFDRPEYRVLHCRSCGHESIRPLPTRAEQEALYNGFAVTMASEEEMRFVVERSIAFLKHFLEQSEMRGARTQDLRYLDVGLGNGAGLLAAAKLGFQSCGIDLDPASVARAAGQASRQGLQMECTATDIHGYRRDLKFDLVRTSHVIDLVLDPRQFVAEIAARQPAGGRLIIECHNNDGAFWRVKNLLRRHYGRMSYYHSLKIGELLSGFTAKSIAILLQGAGYRVTRCRDYAIGDPLLDHEKVLWYPSLFEGVRLALRQWSAYPFLKSLIPVFDRGASLLAGRGTYLSVWAQKA
jgi:2-polyprenyl-3-methyl-5-hydroxy-6-metoxy-1,4-benzoquinol methylase